MKKKPALEDITIRTELKSGDIGYVTYLHGIIYENEYNYNYHFESYVAAGLHEFAENYDPLKDRCWICEHENYIIGCLFLKSREDTAQLRYYLIKEGFRGIGLGKKLMDLYMEFLHEAGYRSSYLWTTKDLEAAASLYRSHGFKLVEEKQSSFWGKEVVEQKYELVLK